MVDFNRNRFNNRPRRQAMGTVATVLILWLVFYQVGTLWQGDDGSGLDRPPRLFVELKSANEGELQLLPDVGPKTARAWRESLSDSDSSATQSTQSLEKLPKVGPVRAVKLAPFLVESEGHEQ